MIKKIRIGHYMPQYGTSTGTGQVLKNLFEIFKGAEGFELIIFKIGKQYVVEQNLNLTVVTYPENVLKILPSFKFLYDIIANTYSINALGIHMPFTLQNYLLYLVSKIPLHYYPHGCFNPKTLKRRDKRFKKLIYFKFFESKIIRKSKKIICATDKEELYLNQLNFNHTSVVHFPFTFPNLDFNEFRQNFRLTNGFKDDDFIISFVGRFDIYTKGLDILIEAIRKAHNFNNNIKAVLIGYDVGNNNNMDEFLRSKNCETFISNLGKVFGKRKFEALIETNLYVQPSRYESFGVSILEAMYLKLPCILSNGCDLAETVYEAEGCYSFNGSIDELTERILYAYENPEVNKLIANKGYIWLNQNLSTVNLLNKWKNIYSISD